MGRPAGWPWKPFLLVPRPFIHPNTPPPLPLIPRSFAADNIGALAVTDASGKVIGVISERDYVCKVRFGFALGLGL